MNKYNNIAIVSVLLVALAMSACSEDSGSNNDPDSSVDQPVDQNDFDVSVDEEYDVLACQKAIDPANDGNKDCPSPITTGVYCCSIGIDNGCDGIMRGGNSSQFAGKCFPSLEADAPGVEEQYVDQHGCYAVRFSEEGDCGL